MQRFAAGSRPTRTAPAEWFTGKVEQDPIVEAEAPARLRAVSVRFDPRARTNWHTHPLGQTLYITSGRGRAQSWGGPMVELAAGDTIWIPPGEKHWHGAAPAESMVHIAMHEALDGTHVEWMEPVSDEQYGG